MIDIHCHILPGIDDGPKSLDETLEIAVSLLQLGIKHVIATPHALDGVYNSSPEQILSLVNEVNAAVCAHGIDIRVYPGAEYPLTPELVANLDKVVTLNNSRYILVELPFNQPIPRYAADTFFKLIAKGLVPVLAHPERCLGFKQNPAVIHQYIQLGALVQVNLKSLYGRYGTTAMGLALDWLKANCVHFLATDSHRSWKLEECAKVPYQPWRRLMFENPRSVLYNQKFEVPQPILKQPSLKDRVCHLLRSG